MAGQIVSSGATYVVPSGVTDSGDVVTDPGSLLIVSSGGITIGATAANGGTEEVLAGGVASNTVIMGGTLELASGGSAGAGAITFSGTGGTLRIDDAAMPANPISGFIVGDAIDLAGVSLASGGLAGLSSGNVLVVSAAGSAYDLQLDQSRDFSGVSFRLVSDGHGGTEVMATNGLSINLTYAASVSSAPAGFLTAVGQEVRDLEAIIAAPATVNMRLGYGEILGSAMSPGALGESGFFLDSFSYADALSALSAGPLTADQLRAYNTLPAVPPEPGTLWLNAAQERVLGLMPTNGIDFDGAIGFSSSVQFSFTSGTTPAPGKFYFIGVAEHEITEVMGRFSLLASTLAGSASFSVMDLFRYASAGALQIGSGAPSYFSIDGGVTNLHSWNNFVTGNHDDLGDWAQGATHDAFDDRLGPGVLNSLSLVDRINMDVIGWDASATSTISSGQAFTVLSGVTISNVHVESGGSLIVAAGGTAYGTVVSSGAAQTVSSGGYASVTVLSGGTETILSGGAALGDFLLAGDEVDFGTATSITVRSGAFLDVMAGGVTNITTVSSGGTVQIGAGGYTSGTIVLSGGTLDVLVGGSASSTVVSSGGAVVSIISSGQSVTVSSGQTASDTIVLSGGSLFISAGGESDITLLSGGTEVVSSGGLASATTIAGGRLELASGATASGAITFSGTGGTLQIDATTLPLNRISGFVAGDSIDLAGVSFDRGGSVVLSTTSSSSNLRISEAGIDYDLHLDPAQDYSHASFRLLSDGHGGTRVEAESGLSINFTYDDSVSSAPTGFLTGVYDDAAAMERLIASPVTVNIHLGYGEYAGFAMSASNLGNSYTFYESYSYGEVKSKLSAGDLSAAQLQAFNTLLADSSQSGTLWLTVAQQQALGLISNNGQAVSGSVGFSAVNPFSYASGTVPPPGEYDFIGTVEHELSEIMGRDSLLEGFQGSAAYTVMDLFRYASSGAIQTTTGDPAYFSIDGGATNLNFWNNYVTGNHGDLGDWAPSAGHDAFLDNSPTGVINRLTEVDKINMNVIGWNLSATAIVSSSQTHTVSSGDIVSNLDVESGGAVVIESSGFAYGTILSSGATQRVSNGGSASVTVLSGGDEIVLPGGATTGDFVLVGNEVVSGFALSATVRSGGRQSVRSGGLTSDTTVSSGGIQDVSAGGVASDTTVDTGGAQDVFAGGVTRRTTVFGGTEIVSSGGTASATTIRDGGTLLVASGGIARATIVHTGTEVVSGGIESGAVVSAGGSLMVSSGGVASGTTVQSGGTLELFGGGAVSGTTTVGAGGILEAGSGYTVSGFIVSSGVTLEIAAGGRASGTVVLSGGILDILSGGSASGTVRSSGSVVLNANVKPAESGLVDMSDISFYQQTGGSTPPTFDVNEMAPYAGSFGEIVLNLRWSDLEPTPGVLDTSFITSAISALEQFNTSHHTDIGIKLRVYGGFVAPDWAKNIDGAPFLISGNHPNGPGAHTVGRFWTADYIDAWQGFQAQLAAVYDDNPIIRGISQTAGALASDEPFVPLKDDQPAILESAGYTDAAEMLTLRGAISDYSAWTTTPLDYTFNPFWHQDTGRAVIDENFPLAVLQQARNSTRLVQPGNHALQAPVIDNNAAFIYAQMTADAALDPTTTPGSFQTQSPIGLEGYAIWPSTISAGVAANGSDIELWDGPNTSGFTGLPADAVQSLAETVAAGMAPTTYAPADGSALGFIAPSSVTAAGGTAAFTGTDAVLVASGVAQNFYAVRVTLTSLDGGTLAVTNLGSIVQGPASGTTISLSGPVGLLNTVLASLTDTASSGHDLVRVVATDIDGNQAVRTVGVVTSTGSSSSGSNTGGDTGFAGELGSSGILLIGGVSASLNISGNLQIGPSGSYTSLLAALSPSAYSTAELTVSGAIEIESAGTARFTGRLSGNTLAVNHGGVLAGGGALVAGSGAIINDGTLEAVADTTLGLQRLVVSNALSGSGTLLIDAGATMVLSGAVDSGQTVVFAPNTMTQFANDPDAPSTLVLVAPHGTQPIITGFSFADRLALIGVSAGSATYSGSTLSVGSLTFTLSGIPAGFTPVASVTGVGSGAETIISFTPPSSGAVPHVSAPGTLRGAVGSAVLLPDVVLSAPLPANAPAGSTVTVTLSATSGTLAPFGSASSSHSLVLTGTVAEIEHSLRSVAYTGSAAGADTLSITISGFGGSSTTSTSITNFTSSQQFDWGASTGDFSSAGGWSTTGGPPGGNDVAAFGAGTYTVSGGGAVGRIEVSGTTTLTGQITAQGIGSAGSALVVDSGGTLTLAGGAVLTAEQRAVVGRDGEGELVVMGAALDLAGSSGVAALVIGEHSTGIGTVVNLETIAASGTVTVGQAGTGTLELLGVAATVSNGDAIVGLSAGAVGSGIVNGGLWTTSGHLTVGAEGSGVLLVDGRQGGLAGQVTAHDATIGAQAGGVGSVMLDGGELLVADASTSSSILVVGGAGSGRLFIDSGGEAAIGVALATVVSGSGSSATSSFVSDNGVLVVGAAAGGGGTVGIGTQGALLVYGDGIVGAGAGTAVVSVGGSGTQGALFALLGNLDVGSTGRVVLAGEASTVRASTFHIFAGGVVSGVGTLSGDGGGNHTVTLASIDNDGAITATGGELLIYGNVVGSGTLSVATSATIILQSTVDSSQVLDFNAGATAVLNDAGAFAGSITDFGAGDILDLSGLDATGATWSGGVLTVDTTSGVLHLAITGSYASNAFTVQSDGHGGTDIVLAPTGSAFVGQGQTLVVSSGQSVSGIVVLNGGRLEILSGGNASGTSVRDGGTLALSSGAALTGTTLDPGSLEEIGAGYVLSGVTISGGVAVDVLSGGLASNTTVLAGGRLSVLAGGAASGTTVSSGGTLLSGLGGGQTLTISSGQTSSSITVISGGTERVLSGGTAIGTAVSSGGLEDVLGNASATTLFSGGTQQVSSGGTASGTVISLGGLGLVSSGGTASGAVVLNAGRIDVLSGASAQATVVSVGGLAIVKGTATGTDVSSGGTLTVLSGGLASSTLVEGTELVVGGITIATSVAGGGRLIVDSGGLASGTVVSSGGTLALVGGGAESATTFLAGATFEIASGYVASGLHVTSDIPLEIANGGLASAAVVDSGGIVTVVSGGTASATDVQGGGSVLVQYGGTTVDDVLSGSGAVVASETVVLGGAASGTVISNNGVLQVLTGGLAIGTIVEDGGTSGHLLVSSGGTVIGAALSSGGIATLGGLSLSAVISSGGVMNVVPHGVNSSGQILDGGEVRLVGGLDLDMIVSSGGMETVSTGFAVSTIVRHGGTQVVSSGGRASNTTVSNGGVIVVVGGGLNSDSIISSGGEVRVAGGADFGVNVSSSGSETVLSGGVTHATRLLSSGSQLVSSGGVALGTLVSAFGVEQVLAGGGTGDTVIYDNGVEVAAAGGTAVHTIISFGGREIVDSAGVASGTVVSSGGTLELLSGGSALSTTLLAGATLEIASGYSISGYGVQRATTLEVGPGGSASAVVVSSGAVEVVSSGVATATQVLGGGTVLVRDGGTTVGDVLLGSGTTLIARETVSSGGVASGTILSNTGLLTVSAGGRVVGAIATNNPLGTSGGLVVLSGGTASSVTLSSGGVGKLLGGTAVSTLVQSGATLSVTDGVDSAAVVSNGATVLVRGGIDIDATVLNGGQVIVSSGGAANRTTLSNGGQVILSSGAVASGIQVRSGGALNVSGGSDLAATIFAGGQVAVFGGTDSGATILSGGTELVLAGGTASAATLSNGGGETVSSGGLALGTIILNGGLESVLAGGTASATVVSSGGRLGVAGRTSGTLLGDGGQEIVSSGGLASAAVVGSGGSELVSSGGLANAVVLLDGGVQTVLKGGVVSATAISSGGREIVSSGGVGRGAVVSNGGREIVVSGGTASATTVLSGGVQAVSSGGVANAVTLSGGIQTVLARGTASGSTVSSGGVEIVDGGTTVATVVGSSGSEVVSSGGTAIGTVIQTGGVELVRSGGAELGATLSGGTLEIQSGGAVLSSTITFAGSGTLVLDDTKFRGKIAGFDSPAETIDLATVSFASATLGYTGNTLSGTLTVTDGTNTARLAMLGNYVAANFHLADDGHGGTRVFDPPVSSGSAIAPPH